MASVKNDECHDGWRLDGRCDGCAAIVLWREFLKTPHCMEFCFKRRSLGRLIFRGGYPLIS